MAIGPRDEELLAALFQHQAMTRGQIQELFFTSTPRCNARLRQLFDFGYVTRHYPPAALWGAQAVYGLGRAAAAAVGRRMDMDEAHVKAHLRTPAFLEHTLEITQFYLDLRTGVAGREDVSIERWLPEMLCRHEYELRAAGGGAWRKETFKPDAFFRLSLRQGNEMAYRNFFVEVDLGHTSSGQFAAKLLGHHRYLDTGLFSEMFGDGSFQTLVVTTGARRLSNLISIVEDEKSDLFWFSTFDQIRKGDVLERIWRVPFQTDPSPLV